MPDRKPIRMLQVVGGMNRAGVETWLMNVLRNIDREQFKMDFLVHTERKCSYDDEIKALGSRVIPCLSPKNPWQYARNFKRILEEYGPYDVVHSHVYHFSGYVLRLAAKSGVPVRIAHSHNTSDSRKDNLIRNMYRRKCMKWISEYATTGLSCSKDAAAALYGNDWQSDSRWKVLYYGIDFKPLFRDYDRDEVRKELGIPTDAKVIGHVGRFVEQKNHEYLVSVFAEIRKLRDDVWLLLVGEGPLRTSIENRVTELGLENYTVFTGEREDVARLMKGAMDVFVFPSKWEGLGLVLVEAQLVGVPCVISENIPIEVSIFSRLIKRLSLRKSYKDWTYYILKCLDGDDKSYNGNKSIIDNSCFSLRNMIVNLIKYYD